MLFPNILTLFFLIFVYGFKIYNYQGNYSKALAYYFKSLKIKKEIGNKRGVANSYNNIGLIYDYQGNDSKALYYHIKSLKIKEKIIDKSGIAYSYNNIGMIYQKRGSYSKALKYHYKSLNIREEIGEKSVIAYSYNNIGLIYSYQGNYTKALNYYFKAVNINKGLGYKAESLLPLLNIGRVYLKQEKLNMAKQYFIDVLSLAKEMGIKVNIRDVAEQLALVEDKLGNYQSAYEYQVLFKQMADSLQNDEQTKKITQIELNYQFEQEKDSLKFIHQLEKVALEKDIDRRRVAQTGTYIILFLLGLLLFTLFLLLRSKTKSNKLLTQKSKELEMKNNEINRQAEEIKSLNKVLEGNLNIANKEVVLKNQKLYKYAFINSHETRSPIATLLGLVSILNTDNIDEETSCILQNIKESAKELDQLTRKMNHILEEENLLDKK